VNVILVHMIMSPTLHEVQIRLVRFLKIASSYATLVMVKYRSKIYNFYLKHFSIW